MLQFSFKVVCTSAKQANTGAVEPEQSIDPFSLILPVGTSCYLLY